jgi:hypothetical protein
VGSVLPARSTAQLPPFVDAVRRARVAAAQAGGGSASRCLFAFSIVYLFMLFAGAEFVWSSTLRTCCSTAVGSAQKSVHDPSDRGLPKLSADEV